MKKKILVSALVLVALIGAATGAYMLYDYNEHKPLILACKLNESAVNPSLVGRARIIKIEASRWGWSIGPDDGLGSTPEYWSFDEEQWKDFEHTGFSGLTADKNKFEWLASDYELIRVDRNSGDFSISICPHSMYPLDRCTDEYGQEEDMIVSARGSCTKSAKPAKTLNQKF